MSGKTAANAAISQSEKRPYIHELPFAIQSQPMNLRTKGIATVLNVKMRLGIDPILIYEESQAPDDQERITTLQWRRAKEQIGFADVYIGSVQVHDSSFWHLFQLKDRAGNAPPGA